MWLLFVVMNMPLVFTGSMIPLPLNHHYCNAALKMKVHLGIEQNRMANQPPYAARHGKLWMFRKERMGASWSALVTGSYGDGDGLRFASTPNGS